MTNRLTLTFVIALAATAYIFVGLDAISAAFDIPTVLLELLLAAAPVGMLAAFQLGRISHNDRQEK